MHTTEEGVTKILEDTDRIKQAYEKLLADMQALRRSLSEELNAVKDINKVEFFDIAGLRGIIPDFRDGVHNKYNMMCR